MTKRFSNLLPVSSTQLEEKHIRMDFNSSHFDKSLQLAEVIKKHFDLEPVLGYISMLNKNTWGVKKCEANQKQHCKQAYACATKNSDIS